MTFTIDLHKMQARTKAGLVVAFKRAESGDYEGRAINTLKPESAASAMREAGEAFMRAVYTRRRELIAAFAERLYGNEWRHALARALGPFHPDGQRESIDPRLVGRWASGERPIPAWVLPALSALLDEFAGAFRDAP